MTDNKRNLYLMSTLKLEESTSTFELFPGTSTLENEIKSTFKYATSDFTDISKSSSIKKIRRLAFEKALGLGNAGKVLSLVFELFRA